MAKQTNSTIPKVAVITRTKDRGILLERAIKSVHGQSMGDLIHVIINDGGDKAVVEQLVQRYAHIVKGRVTIIHNDTSGGMEAASNKAISSSRSLFVAIHDDDDTWHRDFLRHTTERMEHEGSHGVVVTTDKIDEEIVGDAVQEVYRDRWKPEVRTLSLYDLCKHNFAVPISFIYRRAAYEAVGGYDEELPVLGDWDYALRFMLKYDIDFLRTEQALAYYHLRPKATGVMGNTIFAGADTHEMYRTKLSNKYLRNDLAAGRFGIGYLFNQRQQELLDREQERHELDSVRQRIGQLESLVVERSINPQKLKRLASRFAPSLYNRLKR